MINALYWLFGISASLLVVAYLGIAASVFAAKRRMATAQGRRPLRRLASLAVPYRAP